MVAKDDSFYSFYNLNSKKEDDENSTGFWFLLYTNVSLGVYILLLIFSIVCVVYMKRGRVGYLELSFNINILITFLSY